MSYTPEILNVTKGISSVSSAGISKSLLTPCRRVGLSRKRKTPSSITKTCPEVSPSVCTPSITETTPINYGKSLKKKINSNGTPTNFTPPSDNPCLKNEVTDLDVCTDAHTVQKKPFKKELFLRNSDIFCDELSSAKDKTEPLKNCDSSYFKIEKAKHKPDLDPEILTTKPTKSKIEFTHSEPEAKTNTNALEVESLVKPKKRVLEKPFDKLENDSDDDFTLINKNVYLQKQQKTKDGLQKTKRIRRTLSLKKSASVTDDDFDISPNPLSSRIDNARIQAQKTKKTQVYFNKNESITDAACDKLGEIIIIDDEHDVFTSTPEQESAKKESVKECRVHLERMTNGSMCLSENSKDLTDSHFNTSGEIVVDEEDAFTSTPEQEKVKKSDILQKIKQLEKTIKQKREKLAELKRAEIYKKKHNIDDLNQLTSKWMSGCASGLNDLLRQLQAHGPMTMTTLLNNLHIPSDVAAKLPLNTE